MFITAGAYVYPVDIDAAARLTMKNCAAVLGDNDPQYSVISVGPNARIASYRHNSKGNMELIALTHDNKSWMINVIYFNPAHAETAQRIVQSVNVE